MKGDNGEGKWKNYVREIKKKEKLKEKKRKKNETFLM